MNRTISKIAIASLLLLPAISFAVETIPAGPQSVDEFIVLLENVANIVFTVLLIVAVIFILLAAFQFITAGGDPGAVGQARQKILYAAIGILVAVAAKGIVFTVKSIIQ